MALSELQQNVRRGLLQTLQLLSSRQDQLQYQKDVPIAHVTAELFWSWDEYRYEDEPYPQWFIDAFSAAEMKAIQEFNLVFDSVCLAMPEGEFPSIGEFVLTPLSAKLAEAATLALRSFDLGEADEPHLYPSDAN